jgi:hypothetical protein
MTTADGVAIGRIHYRCRSRALGGALRQPAPRSAIDRANGRHAPRDPWAPLATRGARVDVASSGDTASRGRGTDVDHGCPLETIIGQQPGGRSAWKRPVRCSGLAQTSVSNITPMIQARPSQRRSARCAVTRHGNSERPEEPEQSARPPPRATSSMRLSCARVSKRRGIPRRCSRVHTVSYTSRNSPTLGHARTTQSHR